MRRPPPYKTICHCVVHMYKVTLWFVSLNRYHESNDNKITVIFQTALGTRSPYSIPNNEGKLFVTASSPFSSACFVCSSYWLINISDDRSLLLSVCFLVFFPMGFLPRPMILISRCEVCELLLRFSRNNSKPRPLKLFPLLVQVRAALARLWPTHGNFGSTFYACVKNNTLLLLE